MLNSLYVFSTDLPTICHFYCTHYKQDLHATAEADARADKARVLRLEIMVKVRV